MGQTEYREVSLVNAYNLLLGGMEEGDRRWWMQVRRGNFFSLERRGKDGIEMVEGKFGNAMI